MPQPTIASTVTLFHPQYGRVEVEVVARTETTYTVDVTPTRFFEVGREQRSGRMHATYSRRTGEPVQGTRAGATLAKGDRLAPPAR